MQTGRSILVDVLTASRATACKNTWNFTVSSPFNRLYYIMGGRGELLFREGRYELSPGNCYLIPCFTLVEYRCLEPLDHYFVHIVSRQASGRDLASNRLISHVLEQNVAQNFEEDFAQIGRRYTSDSLGDQLFCDGAVRRILSEFYRAENLLLAPGSEGGERRFKPVFDYVEKHIGEDLSLAVLSDLMCLHPTYFSNLFKETFGETPLGFVIRYRIETAQNLLWQSDLPVVQIGEALGYPDPAHFSKLFKKYVGLSPSKYRQQSHRSQS